MTSPNCHPDRSHHAKGLCALCYQRAYYWKNRDERLEYATKYRGEHPDKQREYYAENREKLLKQQKEYKETNKEALAEWQREYRHTHREEQRLASRKWRKENPSHKRNRWRSDPVYRLKELLRARLWKALNGKSKPESTMALVGCSEAELKEYIQGLFQGGMTWENQGKWHIDHIVPLSTFDLSDTEQLRSATHFTNLQPLWAFDNQTKAASLPRGQL